MLGAPALEWREAQIGAPQARVVELRSGCDGPLTVVPDVDGPGFSLPAGGGPLVVPVDAWVPLEVVHAAEGYGEVLGSVRFIGEGGSPLPARLALSAQVAADQDGDGWAAVEAGGADCADADPAVHPAAGDTDDDGEDDDCDGLLDEDLAVAGDVQITELHPRPDAAPGPEGQWIELQNRSDRRVPLQGWRVENAAGQQIQLPPLDLGPGERLLLAGSADPAQTGGVEADLAWDPAAFRLDPATELLRLWADDRVISGVPYDGAWPVALGRALALDPTASAAEARDPASWCPAAEPWAGADAGSPGLENPWCPGVDHDGDGASADDGDCDDADPGRAPGLPERFDGVDEDCDGRVDVIDARAAAAELTGDAGDALGWPAGLGAADLDGDGQLELIFGSAHRGGGAGRVDLVSPAALLAAAGARPEAVGDAAVTGAWAGARLGLLPPEPGDIDGDGAHELILGAFGPTDGAPLAVLFWGGALPDGPASAADLQLGAGLSAAGGGRPAALRTGLDLDGDGLHELILGQPDAGDGGAVAAWTGDALAAASGALAWADAAWTADGAPGAALGAALGGGDLDGDGLDELILGAAGLDALWGLGPGGPADRRFTLAGAAGLGAGAPWVGDLDGDGVAELVAPADDGLFAFRAPAGAVDAAAAAGSITTGALRSGAPAGLRGADLDGDGLVELFFGLPGGDDPRDPAAFTGPGALLAVHGDRLMGATLAAAAADLRVTGVGLDAFGAAAVSADLDGDTLPELIVASPGLWSAAGVAPAGAARAFRLR